MKTILENTRKIIKNPIALIGFFLGFFIIILPSYSIDHELVQYNFGTQRYIVEMLLSFFIAVFFGIFLGATLYKISFFGNHEKKKSGFGILGGFFGILITGCPACSITLASYLGLAGIVSLLPYGGVELKVLSLLLLLYASYVSVRDMEVCSLRKNKKK